MYRNQIRSLVRGNRLNNTTHSVETNLGCRTFCTNDNQIYFCFFNLQTFFPNVVFVFAKNVMCFTQQTIMCVAQKTFYVRIQIKLS